MKEETFFCTYCKTKHKLSEAMPVIQSDFGNEAILEIRQDDGVALCYDSEKGLAQALITMMAKKEGSLGIQTPRHK